MTTTAPPRVVVYEVVWGAAGMKLVPIADVLVAMLPLVQTSCSTSVTISTEPSENVVLLAVVRGDPPTKLDPSTLCVWKMDPLL